LLSRKGAISAPLSSGDIIGLAFRVFRQNIPLILKTLLLPTALLALGRVALTLTGSYAFKSGTAGGIIWAFVGLFGMLLGTFSVVYLYLRQLALVRYFAGFASSIEEAKQYMKRKLWSVVALGLAYIAIVVITSIAWLAIIFLAASLLALKGAASILAAFIMSLAILGGFISFVFIGLAGSLAYNALAIEDSDLNTIIARSFSFTWRAFFRSCGFGLLATTSVSLLAYPLTLPVIIASIIYLIMHGVSGASGSASDLPPQMQVFCNLWETMTQMIIGPIYHIAYGFFFCDLKMRMEGLDLSTRLESIKPNHGPELDSLAPSL
jgi:hypothetical protein